MKHFKDREYCLHAVWHGYLCVERSHELQKIVPYELSEFMKQQADDIREHGLNVEEINEIYGRSAQDVLRYYEAREMRSANRGK